MCVEYVIELLVKELISCLTWLLSLQYRYVAQVQTVIKTWKSHLSTSFEKFSDYLTPSSSITSRVLLFVPQLSLVVLQKFVGTLA